MMGATPLWVRVTFLFVLVVLLFGGYIYYEQQKKDLCAEANKDLLEMAQSKREQIENWRRERLTDGLLISQRDFLAETVRKYMDSGQEGDRILGRLAEWRELKKFRDVLLVDLKGNILKSVLRQTGTLSPGMTEDFEKSVKSGQSVLTDLHRREDGVLHMDVIAPLFAEEKVVAAVILQIDAKEFLYPLLEKPIGQSKTAVTLLVRRDGDDVLFLSNLPGIDDAPLNVRRPLTATDLPAVQAVTDEKLVSKVVEGKDYRGVAVLAVVNRIADSQWYTVSKIDKDEALAPWRSRATSILLGMTCLTLMFLGLVGMVWQRNSKKHFRELFQSERSRRQAEERFRTTLMSVGDGVIATDDQGKVALLNPVAQELTGWSPQEAAGRPVEEVFKIINEESRQTVESPVQRVLREGIVVGLANHTLLVARDGKERPIADSGAPIREGDKDILGAVLVFRDQTEERRIQQLLQSSESRYRHIFSQMQSGAALHEIICDQTGKPVDYRFLEVNPAFEALTGLQRDKIVGKTVREILPGVENRWIETYGRVAMTGDPTRFEEYTAALNRHYEVIAYSPQKGQFAAIFYDITQRKQSEAEIKRINRMLRMISDCNQTLVRSKDERVLLQEVCKIITQTGGFYFACVSTAEDDPDRKLHLTACSGCDEEFFKKANVTWTDTPHGHGPTGTAVRTGKVCIIHDTLSDPRYAPWRELAKKHGYRSTVALPLMLDENIFGALTIAAVENDAFTPQEMLLLEELAGDLSFGITAIWREKDRLVMQEKLHRSEERYRALAENVKMGITWIDSNYQIRAANSEQGRMVNLSSQNLQGRKCHEVLTGSSCVCAHCPGTVAISTGKPAMAEVEGSWDQGRRRHVRLHAYPVLSAQGQAEGFVEVVEDITEQKDAAKTLLALEQQLAHAQRMEAIGQLAGGVAHDFRNQLTVIRGFAEMLSRRELVLEDGKLMLTEVLKAADRSASLTTQLLAFSRKQTLSPKVLDLRGLVEGIARIAPRVIEENVRLHVNVRPEPIFTEIDPGQFEQAMLNLLSNARDAMPGGGDLYIEAGPAGPEDDVAARHSDAVQGPHVCVAVRDTGCGMDSETIARIFEPFFTTKPVGVGTGLGLSMVYGFVRQSNGIVEVQSDLGKGAAFRLYFPRVNAPPTVGSRITVGDHVPSGHEKILLVEDEPAVRKLLSHSLREAGYEVVEAGNPAEAMQIVQEGRPFDLLITDVVMPGGDGIGLAEQIRQLRQGLPVLFLSGYPDPDLARKGATPRQATILSKPVDFREFLKAVRTSLDAR